MNEDDEIALERLVRPDCISDHDDVQLTADSTHQHHQQQQLELQPEPEPAVPTPPPQSPPAPGTADADDQSSAVHRQCAMYARFRSWTQRNYGEPGKTKTVTRAKYERVVAILSGAEPPTADNSKLRFWIKAKGFRLGYPVDTDPPTVVNRTELYIPAKTWVCVYHAVPGPDLRGGGKLSSYPGASTTKGPPQNSKILPKET